MSDDQFPLDVDDFLCATARLLAFAGMREEVRVLAAQENVTPMRLGYDAWDGGQRGWGFDFMLPMQAYRGIELEDRKTMSSRIQEAMRDVMAPHDGHYVEQVRILMHVPKAPPGWKQHALAWSRGDAVSNQGRARSTNIAPFEHDGLLFRSRPEICLYRALKKSGITVAPLPVFIRGGAQYQRLEPDFLLVHRGVVMVVEVDGDAFHYEAPVDAHERLAVLSREGVETERVRAEECSSDAAAEQCARKLVGILEKLATNR